MLFIETSARTKIGIQQAFEELVLKCLETHNLLHQSALGTATSTYMYKNNITTASVDVFVPKATSRSLCESSSRSDNAKRGCSC